MIFRSSASKQSKAVRPRRNRLAGWWLSLWTLVAGGCLCKALAGPIAANWHSQPASHWAAVAETTAPHELDASPTKNIEDVQPGEKVWARDEAGRLAPQRVVRVFRHTTNQLRILEVQSSDDSNVQRISTTAEHPFWVDGAGWTSAGDLRPGQKLLQRDGRIATVIATSTEQHRDAVPVFNFEVENDHSYFVASADLPGLGLWVHNTKKPPNKVNIPSRRTAPETTQLKPLKNRKQSWDESKSKQTSLIKDRESIRAFKDEDGNWRWAKDGELVDVENSPGNQVLYRVDREGNMYIYDRSTHPNQTGAVHHSSLGESFGDEALGAGNISVKNGKLKYIDNDSGHYVPGDVELRNLVNELRAQGADVSDLYVNFKQAEVYPSKGWRYDPPQLPDGFPRSNLSPTP